MSKPRPDPFDNPDVVNTAARWVIHHVGDRYPMWKGVTRSFTDNLNNAARFESEDAALRAWKRVAQARGWHRGEIKAIDVGPLCDLGKTTGYRTEEAAARELARIWRLPRTYRAESRHYLCRACGLYHLTSQERRQQP